MPKRSADESVAASSSRSVSSTAVVGELNAGRDPKSRHGGQERLPPATPAQLQGVAPGGYLLTEPEHLSKFLPSHATRDGKNNLLLNWDLLKLMPPSFYALVFECADKRGTFRAVSESKLALDGYPEASRSGKDVDNQAGFKRREDLRLVLFPNAFRILWAEIDQPLRDAWPAARAVMERGFVLKEHTRGLVDAKLDPLCASFEATAWATELRAALHSRHWPTRPPAPAPAPAPAEPVTLPGPATRSRTSPDLDEADAPADSPCGLLAAIRRAALSVDCNPEACNTHLRPGRAGWTVPRSTELPCRPRAIQRSPRTGSSVWSIRWTGWIDARTQITVIATFADLFAAGGMNGRTRSPTTTMTYLLIVSAPVARFRARPTSIAQTSVPRAVLIRGRASHRSAAGAGSRNQSGATGVIILSYIPTIAIILSYPTTTTSSLRSRCWSQARCLAAHAVRAMRRSSILRKLRCGRPAGIDKGNRFTTCP